MTSSRPYLLRAIHQWIVDNDCTPYLLVNAVAPGVDVPSEFVENDKIILNVSPSAAYNLTLGDDEVGFDARFGGKPRSVVVPLAAVLAIYARENGQGMLFTDETDSSASPSDDGEPDTGTGESDDAPASRGKRPNLRVIK